MEGGGSVCVCVCVFFGGAGLSVCVCVWWRGQCAFVGGWGVGAFGVGRSEGQWLKPSLKQQETGLPALGRPQ